MDYIESYSHDPQWNLALEQYVFDEMDRSRSYVMLWQNHNTIVVGKNQNTVNEVNSDYVRRHGITVVRRLSGGGAVYHDLGNLNFTFITDADDSQRIDLHMFCIPIVETLRSFLSRQNDIYRAAFGKRATPHLRQCVFFGTTNAESGYLRDTTGNRRFWPVKTPGTGIKHSWDLTPELICQIWAETLVYVKQGEKLYLSAELEALSKAEQREAMESDEREGLVRLYLDTLLPEDWDGMDIFERRNFLTGSDFGDTQKHGTVKRTQVSNMEIWCECFGKERANIRRTDSNELTAILARLGWKRLDSKVRIPLYGPQYVFVPKECS